jgi:uncharacterized protein (UPF0332 family)
MKSFIKQYLRKAESNLRDAKFLLEMDSYDSCVNRAYYAIFHCVEAFLFLEETHPKTHEGAMRKFSELYIKTNILDKKWASIFRNTLESRQDADYDLNMEISKDVALETYESAESFLSMTKQYFENLEED